MAQGDMRDRPRHAGAGDRQMTALDPRAMRLANAETVLRALYGADALSQAAIATATGLSRRTVELILVDLEAEGWVRVRSTEPHASGRGRPARQYAFRSEVGVVLGIDIAHDRSTVAAADLRGRTLHTAVVPMPGEPERAERLAGTRRAVAEALRAVGVRPGQVGSVSVATPGNVNDKGAVDVELSMHGWTGVRLAEEFAPDFAVPVHVENNAKLAVLAELWEGATPGADHLLWLMLEGQYNGMGIVMDGVPYRGVDGAAGEIFWAKGLGLDALTASPLIGLGRLEPEERRAEATAILERAERGDPAALSEVDSFADVLARGLSALSWVFAPRYVVLGGWLAWALGDLLATRVAARMARNAPPFVAVRRSTLGPDAVVRGAIRAALDRYEWTAARPLAPERRPSPVDGG
ncbi:ROK family transcriptional regulator [Phytohabitans suffuscus]|uniref:Transcriptional regulator n=1 Tax=Phytohabitans suffuscus TaxID=624315 RepID=A0A6F8YRH2_9ACTN|nr:ROK family transcriptional regulator [Phytohabitans suffuscus]BCB88750.1 transcriptional regulator [Phytohabitans suffuscus]